MSLEAHEERELAMEGSSNTNELLELFETAVEKMGCGLGRVLDEVDTRVAVMNTNHSSLGILFKSPLRPGYVGFGFSYAIPVDIPPGAIQGVHELVNLMNIEVDLGRFVFMKKTAEPGAVNRIAWRCEMPVVLLGDDGDEFIACTLEAIRHIFENFYPVIVMFFSGRMRMVSWEGELRFWGLKTTPEEAMRYLVPGSRFGRA